MTRAVDSEVRGGAAEVSVIRIGHRGTLHSSLAPLTHKTRFTQARYIVDNFMASSSVTGRVRALSFVTCSIFQHIAPLVVPLAPVAPSAGVDLNAELRAAVIVGFILGP